MSFVQRFVDGFSTAWHGVSPLGTSGRISSPELIESFLPKANGKEAATGDCRDESNAMRKGVKRHTPEYDSDSSDDSDFTQYLKRAKHRSTDMVEKATTPVNIDNSKSSPKDEEQTSKASHKPEGPDSNTAKSKSDRLDPDLHDSRAILGDKTFGSLVHLLEGRLKGPAGVSCPDTLKYCQKVMKALEKKYKEAKSRKKPFTGRKGRHPRTKEEFAIRLKGYTGDEEKEHPWAAPPDPTTIPGVVMRAWDEMSEGQIKDPRSGFLSGGSDDRLDTYDLRKLCLTRHSDWRQRKKTPFISFTSSHQEIVEERVPHFQKRQKKKQILDNTKLTLVNTRARLADGLPILKMATELKYYKVTNGYGNPFDPRYTGNSFYADEYLMPYSVCPKQIIGTWAWRDIEAWMKTHEADFAGWYSKVGLVAYKEHERVRLGGTPVACKSGCTCCGQ